STTWTSTPASSSTACRSRRSAGRSSRRSWRWPAARRRRAKSVASARRSSRRGASGRRCDEVGVELPNREQAYVPRKKLTDYLLSETHPEGRSKAIFFRGHGYNENYVDWTSPRIVDTQLRV